MKSEYLPIKDVQDLTKEELKYYLGAFVFDIRGKPVIIPICSKISHVIIGKDKILMCVNLKKNILLPKLNKKSFTFMNEVGETSSNLLMKGGINEKKK